MGVELFEPTKQRIRDLVGFPIVDADVAAGANINADKIGTGVVDNTEFNRLNGITSVIEEQGNKGAVSGYAGLDASQELLLVNFPAGAALQVLRRNAGNTALEFAAPAGGSDTPWTVDHDAAGFDLKDLSNLEFRDPSAGVPLATVNAIYVQASGMIFNTVTGNLFEFSINDVNGMTLSATTLTLSTDIDMNGNNIIAVEKVVITSILPQFILEESDQAANSKKWATEVTGSSYSIAAINDAETTNTSAIKIKRDVGSNEIDNIKLKTGPGTSRLTITDTALTVGAGVNLDMVTNDILNSVIVTPTIASFVNATHDHQAAVGGGTLLSTSALSDTADIAYLNTANTFIAGNKNTFAHSATTAGIAVLPIAGNPSGQANGDIWLNVTSQPLFARINGANVDLGAAAGGSQTPWLQDIDADGFDLNDLSNILFRNSTGVPTATDRSIHYNDAEGMVFNALTGDFFQLEINAVQEYRFTNTQADFNSNNVVNMGTLNTHTIPGGTSTFALFTDNLSVFAATTSAQLSGIISDETGSGALVFATSPTFVTPVLGTPSSGTLDLINITLIGSVAEFNVALQSETFAYIGVANAWSTVNQNIAVTGKWQEGGVNISPIGVHDIWIPGGSMTSTTTNGAESTTRELAENQPTLQLMAFDTATEEHAQFFWTPPRNWDRGTITYEVYWTASAGSGTFTCDVGARAFGNDDPLGTDIIGAEISVTDTLLAINDQHISPTSAALTVQGTLADAKQVIFQLSRPTTDTIANDVEVIGIFVHFTTDAGTAA